MPPPRSRGEHSGRLAIGLAGLSIATAAAVAPFFGLRLCLGFERSKILGHRMLLPLRVGPVELARRLALKRLALASITAATRRKPLTFDEACCHALCNHPLEDVAQGQITVINRDVLTRRKNPTMEQRLWHPAYPKPGNGHTSVKGESHP